MKLFKKLIALSLSAAMLACAGNAASLNMAVSAYSLEYEGSDVFVYNDFEYIINDQDTVEIVGYQGAGGHITIPGSIDGKKVVSIGKKAFMNQHFLTEIDIPTTVESIGINAFLDCDSLKKLRMPDSVKTMGFAAFARCYALKTVKLSANLKSVSSRAFSGCIALESIKFPAKLQYIDSEAFIGCEKLTEITLPCNTLNGAFQSCHGLKKVTVTDGCTSLGYAAFQECWSLEQVELSDNITNIGYSCFQNCERLASVKLPENLTALNSSVFASCTNLASVTFGSKLTSIGAYAFSDDIKIQSVKLPDTMRSIGTKAFYNTSLTNVPYGKTLAYIGDYAFANCQKINSIYLPDTITGVGNGAFSGCGNLTYVRLPAKLYRICDSLFANCSRLATVQTGSNIGEIGYHAFYNCTSLKRLDVTSTLYAINDAAFENCTNCTFYGEAGTYAEQFAIRRAIPFVALLTNKCSVVEPDVLLGDIIVFRYNASGGRGNYEYSVTYKKTSDKKYITLQGYQSDTGFVFTPKEAAKYDVCIAVRDADKTVRKKYFVVSANNPIKNLSAIQNTTINSGESIHITGKASGGLGTISYCVKARNDSERYTYTKIGYTTNTNLDVPLNNSGTYTIYVYAQDSKGNVSEKTFTVTVKYTVPKNVSELSATTIRYGETVRFYAKAQGGDSPYTYRIAYRPKGTTQWVVLQDYQTRVTSTFKPNRIGDFDIYIKIRDAKGNVARKDFTLKVVI